MRGARDRRRRGCGILHDLKFRGMERTPVASEGQHISRLYSVSRPTHITNSTYPSRSVSMPMHPVRMRNYTKYSSPQPAPEAEHTRVCTKSAKQASPRPSFCPRLTGRLLAALQKFSTPTPRNPTPRGEQSQGGWRARSWRSVMLACSEATRARPPPAPSAVASWGVPP